MYFWRRASIPSRANDAFPALCQIYPLFPKNFRLRGRFQKNFRFPSAKFWLFRHWLKILNSLFSLFQCIFLPISRTLLFSPTFSNFPTWFCKMYVFYMLWHCVFRYPLVWPWRIYASQNAALDVPASDALQSPLFWIITLPISITHWLRRTTISR